MDGLCCTAVLLLFVLSIFQVASQEALTDTLPFLDSFPRLFPPIYIHIPPFLRTMVFLQHNIQPSNEIVYRKVNGYWEKVCQCVCMCGTKFKGQQCD